MEHEKNYVKTIANFKLTSAQTPTGCSFARHLLGEMDEKWVNLDSFAHQKRPLS